MESMSRNERVRSVLGASALAVGSVTLAAVTLLNPYASEDNQVVVARTQTDRLTLWALLWLGSSLLLLVGVVTVMGRVRQRGAVLAMVGGTLAAAGTVGMVAVAAFESVPISLASVIADDDLLAKALTSFDTSAVLAVVFVLYLAGTTFGPPLLAGGAARAGLLSAWWVLPVSIAAALQVIDAGGLVVKVVGLSCFVVPMLVLARSIARPEPAEVRVAADGPLAVPTAA